jgi:CDP-diacylglycerol--serine O-phosphatidyltransferase
VSSPLLALHPCNALTCVALGAGVGAIAAAVHQNPGAAAGWLAAAALADTFDGRFARLFQRTREMEAIGVELDSLSDAVTFGVAPVAAVGILSASSSTPSPLWWGAAVLYVACALARLAHYNTAHASDSRTFSGLPTPASALIWATVLALGLRDTAMPLVATLLAVAMVTPIEFRRPAGAGLALFALWPAALILLLRLR